MWWFLVYPKFHNRLDYQCRIQVYPIPPSLKPMILVPPVFHFQMEENFVAVIEQTNCRYSQPGYITMPGGKIYFYFLQHSLLPRSKHITITIEVNFQLLELLWIIYYSRNKPTHLEEVVLTSMLFFGAMNTMK